MTYRKTSSFRIDSITGALILVAFLVALFFVVKYSLIVLSWVAPLLLVAALIIDRSVVINYVKWIFSTLKSNPLLGIGAIVFTVLGYMVVFPFLFAKALFKRKIKGAHQRFEQEKQGELIDFEEIESKPKKDAPLELPQLKKQGRKSEYDQLFE